MDVDTDYGSALRWRYRGRFMRTKYTQRKPGEWFPWGRRGYRWSCCDCGLVHVVNHKKDKRGHTLVQMFRDERATAGRRRGALLRAHLRTLLVGDGGRAI